MADNYLEHKYEDFLAGKGSSEVSRRRWQKQLRAYHARLKEKTESDERNNSNE